ncbi:MAG: hypothetical protein DRP82_01235, partial [Planctomycetota bacterium]
MLMRVVGSGGIRRDISPHDMPQDALYDVQNMEADRLGRLRVIKGRKRLPWEYDDSHGIVGIGMVWRKDSDGDAHSELAVSASERTDIVRESSVTKSEGKFGTTDLKMPHSVQIVSFRPGLAFKTVGVDIHDFNGMASSRYSLTKVMLPTEEDALWVKDSVAGVPWQACGSSPPPDLTFSTESGNVPAGTWQYGVVFYNKQTGALGDIIVRNFLNLSSPSKVTIDNIPTYTADDGQKNFIWRKILRRTVEGSSYGDWYVVGTIQNNTDTTYVDNLEDHTTGTLYEEDKVGTPPYGEAIAVWLGRLWIASGET